MEQLAANCSKLRLSFVPFVVVVVVVVVVNHHYLKELGN